MELSKRSTAQSRPYGHTKTSDSTDPHTLVCAQRFFDAFEKQPLNVWKYIPKTLQQKPFDKGRRGRNKRSAVPAGFRVDRQNGIADRNAERNA